MPKARTRIRHRTCLCVQSSLRIRNPPRDMRQSKVRRRKTAYVVQNRRDSVYGALLCSKTKKPDGLNWPWACHSAGPSGVRDWGRPLLDMRCAHGKVNDVQSTHAFPRFDLAWNLVTEGSAPYCVTRRRVAPICVGFGGRGGESYTLHAPKNLPRDAANQMSYGLREIPSIGKCPINGRIPGIYGRCVCARGILLRNTDVHRIAAGWGISPVYHLPSSAVGNVRLGRPDGPESAAITPPAHATTDGSLRDIPPGVVGAQVGVCHSAISTCAVRGGPRRNKGRAPNIGRRGGPTSQ